jgi:hypothetical protein
MDCVSQVHENVYQTSVGDGSEAQAQGAPVGAPQEEGTADIFVDFMGVTKAKTVTETPVTQETMQGLSEMPIHEGAESEEVAEDDVDISTPEQAEREALVVQAGEVDADDVQEESGENEEEVEAEVGSAEDDDVIEEDIVSEEDEENVGEVEDNSEDVEGSEIEDEPQVTLREKIWDFLTT